jgi:hypothetical protein
MRSAETEETMASPSEFCLVKCKLKAVGSEWVVTVKSGTNKDGEFSSTGASPAQAMERMVKLLEPMLKRSVTLLLETL